MTEQGIHIALASEHLGSFFGIPITNTVVMSFAFILLIGCIVFLVRRSLSMVPGRAQVVFEMLFTGVLDYMTETLEDEKLARKLFPILLTIFLFVLIANLVEFVPGIGSIGLFHGNGEATPILRSMNTDLNMTLALAFVAVFTVEVFGIMALGTLRHGKKFVNLSSAMGFFVGIIEIFSEVARLVSFSFRLFGNIFAGEVIILVIQHFVPMVLPVPLMAFEIFVGFVQAAIFALLTLFFVKIAVAEAH